MGYASQLKLFKVVPPGAEGAFCFQNKRKAKKMRDTIREACNEAAKQKIVIMRGPDHWRGESFNKSRRTRGSRSA